MNLETFLGYLGAGLAAMLALGAAVRAGRSIPRWAFSAGMLVLAAERAFSAASSSPDTFQEMLEWQRLRFAALAFLPGSWLLFSLTYSRGNAREFLAKWRWALAAAFALPLLTFLVGIAGPASRLIYLVQEEAGYVIHFGSLGVMLQLELLVTIVFILVNLERTFRASVGTTRWRIKFMILGLGVLFVVRLYTSSQSLLFHITDTLINSLNSAALVVSSLLILRSAFRSGKADFHVYPSHSVLQGSVTILLAGTYLVIVGVFAKVAAALGGDSAFALKALVVLVFLVLLAVLLQSDRIRLQLRRFVSRHFQRPLYDYETVWQKFTEATASRVEQTEFCRAVVKLVAEIFESLSVALWIVDDHREELNLVASTSLSQRQGRELKPAGPAAAAVISHLRNRPDPVDIELLNEDWAETLRRSHPDEFHKGGTRVCVPVVSGGDVLAVIILGDRVGGTPFTLQDLDLLKSIGNHVASGLLNVRLSQRLLQAREHEAFQAMAAFFVHDLKNAASTLNLMLQNLPEHFDDPAFREDALRGAAKSVAHINNLISRLSQLRSELKIQPVESDLNDVVGRTVSGLENGTEFRIEKNFGQVPQIALDREQFAKVVTNLVLNAREATDGRGRLRIATSVAGGWAVLTAEDDGCGMSPEFVERSLFRPFQTTKKTGLGIGMFQSKMIVEAHGGRIAVESTPRQGTTFRVFLPISPLSR